MQLELIPRRLNEVSVLVAEPDPLTSLALAASMAAEGAKVSVARTERAARLMTGRGFAAVVVGARAGCRWGLSIVEAIRRRGRRCVAVVLTDDVELVRARLGEDVEVLQAPIGRASIARAIRGASCHVLAG